MNEQVSVPNVKPRFSQANAPQNIPSMGVHMMMAQSIN